jgi:hypothetical protein
MSVERDAIGEIRTRIASREDLVFITPDEWPVGGSLIPDSDFGHRLPGRHCAYPVRVTVTGRTIQTRGFNRLAVRCKIEFLADDNSVESVTRGWAFEKERA